MDNSPVESRHHVITREDKGPAKCVWTTSQNQSPELLPVKTVNKLTVIVAVSFNDAFDLQDVNCTPLSLPWI